MGSSVLMEFGWLFVASVKPGVALPMPTLQIFDDVALLAGSNYRLPSTHPFSHHCSTTPSSNSTGNGTSAPVLNTAASVPRGEVAASSDLIQVSKSKATQVLCNFQTSTPDADIAALAGALGEALGLNL